MEALGASGVVFAAEAAIANLLGTEGPEWREPDTSLFTEAELALVDDVINLFKYGNASS